MMEEPIRRERSGIAIQAFARASRDLCDTSLLKRSRKELIVIFETSGTFEGLMIVVQLLEHGKLDAHGGLRQCHRSGGFAVSLT